MAKTTRGLWADIETIGYQFLRDNLGWALYDVDNREEVRGSRAKSFGDSIWASAYLLGLM